MLNLNYNFTDTIRRRGHLDTNIINWAFYERTITSASQTTDTSPITFATMSIAYNPYTPTTLYISGSGATGSLATGSKLGQEVLVALTGSGVWPTTGSNQLSIYITNNFGFVDTAYLNMSAQAGNMYLSGSKIALSFIVPDKKTFNIIGQANHTKGNIYNPNVSWVLKNTSPLSTLTPINNSQSASFNLVKNATESLYSFNNVTGSTSSSFAYAYNFGVTASLTSSIENSATGSTTMSINIPEAGVATSSYYFNANSAGTHIITSSFAATTDAPYTITSSITYNKGNISTASINWDALSTSNTQDLVGDSTNLNGVSSSFTLKKDIATMVSILNATGSTSGNYSNDYSFNQTASIVSNVNNTTGSVTMSISITEAGIYTSSYFFNPTTTQAYISASFAANTIKAYNITASIINNKGNTANSNINWNTSGSDNGYGLNTTASFGIRKNAIEQLVNVNNVLVATGSTFKNAYAFNITASLTSSYTPTWNSVSTSFRYDVAKLEISEIGFIQSSSLTSSLITASFTAVTTSGSYNITGSVNGTSIDLMRVTITAIGAGGGGGSSSGGGAGGGAGAVFTQNIILLSNKKYIVSNIGVGGAGAINGNNGNSGSSTVFTYESGSIEGPIFTQTVTLIASGGGGGLANTIGGISGTGITSSGNSGGSGTITSGGLSYEVDIFQGSKNHGGPGGTYLGGGGGSTRIPGGVRDFDSIGGIGGIAPTITVAAPLGNPTYYPIGTAPTFSWTGSGGTGGYVDLYTFQQIQPATSATALGAGGGGTGAYYYAATGGSGGNGALIVSYFGSGSLEITGGFLQYDAVQNLTTAFITQNNGTFTYKPQ